MYFDKDCELFVEQHKKFNYLFYGKLVGKIKLNMAQFINNKKNIFTFPMDKTNNIHITLKLQVIKDGYNIDDSTKSEYIKNRQSEQL
jgi:hypothetical protein